MERAASSIQVLLQAAEFLERRDRIPPCLAEAEHGYASLCPARPRRAGSGGSPTTAGVCGGKPYPSDLPALTARRVPQRLQEQEVRARRVKERLRSRQHSLRQRLEQLLSPGGAERSRADSLDSSQLSEQSGSDGEEAEIDVEGAGLSVEPPVGFSTGKDHSYSSPRSPWS
ncbi:MAD3 protein, partial [Odontophorus gujanensis]|nr:MAD3 protein [Odontophorus gujanensis]